jgi:glycosyltransferase involved in cell wall biosynthesis
MGASIAIITRTKNRPLLLRRCLLNVAQQTCGDYVQVIVNDGGEPAVVEACINETLEQRSKIQVVHHPVSLGLGAATNSGIKASDSSQIAMLDDDDTWDANFLEVMTAKLAARRRASVGGVACQTRIIREEMSNNVVTFVNTEDFNPELRELLLLQLAAKNRFTLNAFLYERRCLEKVGFYREDLPALDDWDFNLRFLYEFDIDVFPQPLANWHWRTGSGGSQTMSAGNGDHQFYKNYLRNEWLREDIRSGRPGLGFLVAMATAFESAGYQLEKTTRVLHPFNRILSWLRS